MGIRIDISEDMPENEIVIKCKELDDDIQKIYQFIQELQTGKMDIICYRGNEEYYIPVNDILFFETDVESVYAHTVDNAYRVKYRLYELEESLPNNFMRISKSTIFNIDYLHSIEKNITSASLVKMKESHKQIYVSRRYYKDLKKRLEVRRFYEA